MNKSLWSKYPLLISDSFIAAAFSGWLIRMLVTLAARAWASTAEMLETELGKLSVEGLKRKKFGGGTLVAVLLR